jgi:hypothetical protein
MATSEGLTGALAAAHAEVHAIDWTSWQMPPGDAYLADHAFGDEPALTNGLMGSYLSTCAWIWNRPITPDEQQRAVAGLLQVWIDNGLSLQYQPLFDVLSVAALPDVLRTMAPEATEEMRQELLALVPDGRFPGIDVAVPGAEAAAAIEQAKIPPSTLSTPDVTGVALDGLYLANTFGLQFDVLGPPSSTTWGTTTELYAFFPDGTYLFFPSPGEAGAHIQDPVGHKAWHGEYEVKDDTIRLYDASDGTTNSSDFTATPDRKQIKFYGKDFTWVSDTTNLRPAAAG